MEYQTNSPEWVSQIGNANNWAVNEHTLGTIYSPVWPHMMYPYPEEEMDYPVWFTVTFGEMLQERAKDGYVYEFDKEQHAAWFTSTLKDLVDERARTGYVYVLE
jgi:hypothetical protein